MPARQGPLTENRKPKEFPTNTKTQPKVLHKGPLLRKGSCTVVYASMPGLVLRTYPHANGTTRRSGILKKKFQKELGVYMMVLKDRLDDADAQYVHRGRRVGDEYAFIEARALGDVFDFVSAPKHDTCFLHNRCVFMKDFKLENCLLFPKKDGQYLLRVADFNIVQHGVSELYSGVDESMRCRGTFLAPEEQQKQQSVGLSADVYRVGHALYVLFFAGAHEEKTHDQQKYRDYQWEVLFPVLSERVVSEADRTAVRERLIKLWCKDPLIVDHDRQSLTYMGCILDFILTMLHPLPKDRMKGAVCMKDYWTYTEHVILDFLEALK
jgi:serine/threonine protein kinase